MVIDSSRLSLLYDVHRVAYLTDRLVEHSLEDHELSGTEFAVYSYLIVSEPVTVSDVAEGIAASMPTTSKLLSRIDERGHLVRQENPEDGRSTLVELSERGRAAHREARPGFGAALRRVQDQLGGAIDDVRWALGRLDHALTSALDGRDTPPPEVPAGRSLSYDGSPLTAGEEAEARRYLDWLRWQRKDHA